jgi:hypothetical protein
MREFLPGAAAQLTKSIRARRWCDSSLQKKGYATGARKEYVGKLLSVGVGVRGSSESYVGPETF